MLLLWYYACIWNCCSPEIPLVALSIQCGTCRSCFMFHEHERKQNGEVENNCTFTTSKDLSSRRWIAVSKLPGRFLPSAILLFSLTISFLASLVLFTRAPFPLNSSSSQPPLSFSSLSFFSYLFFSFLFFLSFLSTSSQFFHPSSATALCTSISIIGNLLVHTLCILLTFCSHRVTLLPISVTIQILSVRSLQPLSPCWKTAHRPHSVLYSVYFFIICCTLLGAYPQHCCEQPVPLLFSLFADVQWMLQASTQ